MEGGTCILANCKLSEVKGKVTLRRSRFVCNCKAIEGKTMTLIAKRLLFLGRYFSFCSVQFFWFMLFDVIRNDFVLRLFLFRLLQTGSFSLLKPLDQ